MEKNKSCWKQFTLAVVLAAVMLLALIKDLSIWVPHGDQGFLSAVASVNIGIYALLSAIRRRRAHNLSGFIAAILLLTFAAIIFWVSFSIPFCPECDGGVDSALMRWLLADKL